VCRHHCERHPHAGERHEWSIHATGPHPGGHTVSAYTIVKDEPADIRRLLTHFIQAEDTDAILLSGGTGLSPRDGTYEVVHGCLEKELTGFGELFRSYS